MVIPCLLDGLEPDLSFKARFEDIPVNERSKSAGREHFPNLSNPDINWNDSWLTPTDCRRGTAIRFEYRRSETIIRCE
jgi:hypothetical protein